MHDHSLADKSPAVPLGASVLDARGHMCAFFRNDDEAYRILLPFILEGFERGERAFRVVDPERREHRVRRLREAGIDVPAAEARGQVDLRDWSRAHLRNGRFDQDRMIALAAEAIDYARRNGYRQTRFVMRTHPMIIIGGVLYENPFFLPPDEFLREQRELRSHHEHRRR